MGAGMGGATSTPGVGENGVDAAEGAGADAGSGAGAGAASADGTSAAGAAFDAEAGISGAWVILA
jgi:hypothetical protein